MRRVAVTGLGMVSPVGLNVKDSWNAAVEAKSGVDFIQSFDASDINVKVAAEVKGFDPLSCMEPKEAKRSTRFIQFACAASNEALADSGLEVTDNEKSDRYGCSIGVGIGGIDFTYRSSLKLAEKGPRKISPFFIPYIIPNMAAGIVANHNNLRGPNICTTTACTSGTHGIGEAFLLIRNNMADAMVCGGSEAAVSKLPLVSFGNMKALSLASTNPKEASMPFDLRRNGFVLGEGAGVMVLEEWEHAKSRGAKIYAELVGYGMSGDAFHITAPAPEGEGAGRCMKMALKTAEVSVESIDYINAHGTSTKLNDLYETRAIINLFGSHAEKLAVSSTKGVTGHCLGAAGGIEGIFSVLSLQEQKIAPTANLRESDPECSLNYVPLEARDMKLRYAMSNSFGFGGTNGTLLFKST